MPGKFCQKFIEKLIPVLHKPFQKKKKETLLNTQSHHKKAKLQSVSLINIGTKYLQQNTCKPNPEIYKKYYIP